MLIDTKLVHSLTKYWFYCKTIRNNPDVMLECHAKFRNHPPGTIVQSK